jgi:dGTPase
VTPGIRERAEAAERERLCAQAALSSGSGAARDRGEPGCPYRTAFEVDRHRIVQSKAFRRLKGKTQVFLWPEGDHYRTRLTHCQEVSQIARTLARALHLNEDLAEAIALGHDLGHAPFGHAGEATMQKLVPGGFRHERQSLRVVERLENNGEGLNLTIAVRDGVARHSKGAGPILAVPAALLPGTLEGQIVRLADIVAYVNHDLDDAVRAQVLAPGEVPPPLIAALGADPSARTERLVLDIVAATEAGGLARIAMSAAVADALEALRAFLYDRVYLNPRVHAEFHKAEELIERLWGYFVADLDRFYAEHWPGALRDGTPEDDVRDFVSGMTDAFAVSLYEELFTPRRWYVL